MSSGGGSSNGKGNNGAPSIPATSRKMVQSLKEIVNYPEHEIYAMLKECNMDPNEAVQRLLTQDTFHEVKSKREKKKENKDTTESRSRGVSSALNRGSRSVADRNVGRGGSSQFSSSEYGGLHGKPVYKKENGASAISSSMPSGPGIAGNNITRHPMPASDSVTAESKPHSVSTADGVLSSSQPSPGYQPAWVGVPGQISMADVVRMGRPKASCIPIVSNEASFPPPTAVLTNASQNTLKHPIACGSLSAESNHNLYSSLDTVSKVPETDHEPGIATSQHNSHDEWPMVEQSQAASRSSVLEPSAVSEVYTDSHIDRGNRHLTSLSDEVQVSEGDVTVENLGTDCAGSASGSNRHTLEDNSGGMSHFDNTSFQNMSSLHPHRHAFEAQEGINSSSKLSVPSYSFSSVEDISVVVSSAAAEMQQLNLRKDELGVPPTEDNPAVIIPNHLQVSTADFSHLSFGSFGSGNSGTFSGSFVSKPSKSNLEEAPVVVDSSSVGDSEPRNPKYYGDEQQLRTMPDGNVDPRIGASTGNFESPSSSQPEVMKQDTAEATHGHQYPFPSSVHGYTFENTTQPNAAFSYAQINSQMQNPAPFSSVMQSYTNSLPSNLLAPAVQPVRESDIPYSPFIATQSMPTKYNTSASSISGPSTNMPEAAKPGIFFSTPQPTAQTLPGTSIATGPALPQHLAMHPYSQPTLPLGHFANMIGYPFLPQSYTYMPSAFQQAYTGNNTAYHQSPAAVHNPGIKYTLPQYKNSISTSNLSQTGAIASGYGGFGSSTNVPGSFPLNPSSTPPSTTMGYDDVISSQYKDSNHYVPLQQNENPAIWVQGPPGSRTVSALPANTYYSIQGQSQQHGGFRQGQQPSQHYGAYPNFYHSQQGVSQEHQQNNLSDGTLGGSQGAPSKQSHQIWQHSY